MISRELHMLPSTAGAMLDRFAVANLLDIRVTGDVRYQFRPGSSELETGAWALATAYRADPAGIMLRLRQTPRRSIRDFADAFRIRRHGPR